MSVRTSIAESLLEREGKRKKAGLGMHHTWKTDWPGSQLLSKQLQTALGLKAQSRKAKKQGEEKKKLD